MLANFLCNLVKRHLLVEAFRNVAHTIHRNEVLAAQVLSQLLEASDALVVEKLRHFALLEGG